MLLICVVPLGFAAGLCQYERARLMSANDSHNAFRLLMKELRQGFISAIVPECLLTTRTTPFSFVDEEFVVGLYQYERARLMSADDSYDAILVCR